MNMRTQHISEIYPNVISITQIRQDIDSLIQLLEKFPEVKVLRGQRILFTAVRPEESTKVLNQIKTSMSFFDRVSSKYAHKGTPSASEWVSNEREKMKQTKYYGTHRR